MTNTYQLIPFTKKQTRFAVETNVERIQNLLMITFSLDDIEQEVYWPTQESHSRQDFLWESTCFEAFIGSPNQVEYFELNLSPSLAWNLYRFTDYRKPNDMPPPRVIEPALIKFEVHDRTITAEIDLNILNLTDQEIKLGLTAVIKTADRLEYLAVCHPKSQADFHDSMGWTIRLLPEG